MRRRSCSGRAERGVRHPGHLERRPAGLVTRPAASAAPKARSSGSPQLRHHPTPVIPAQAGIQCVASHRPTASRSTAHIHTILDSRLRGNDAGQQQRVIYQRPMAQSPGGSRSASSTLPISPQSSTPTPVIPAQAGIQSTPSRWPAASRPTAHTHTFLDSRPRGNDAGRPPHTRAASGAAPEKTASPPGPAPAPGSDWGQTAPQRAPPASAPTWVPTPPSSRWISSRSAMSDSAGTPQVFNSARSAERLLR
jgi:hypothetical protein